MKMVETDKRSNEGLNIPLSPEALPVEQEYPVIELDSEIAVFSVVESRQSWV